MANKEYQQVYRPKAFFITALKGLSSLPLLLLAWLGRGMGWLLYRLDSKRRRIAAINLELCFPKLSASDRKKLAQKHFMALGQSLFCTLGITWHKPRERLRRWVRLVNREYYDNALQQGKNIIVLTPHFVGLELAWGRLSMERQMVMMYRQPRKNLLHWAVDRRRDQFGGMAVKSCGNLKRLICAVQQGIPFYYLPDLDQGKRARHVFAPFFGISTATVTALSRIAKMTDAVVIPCIARQGRPGRAYEITFLPPLENFPSGDPLADAARVNRMITHEVEITPEQYFWIHRRFKTRPDDEPCFYSRQA